MHGEITKCVKCRSCDSTNLTELFSIGEQYVSDFLNSPNGHTGPKCEIALLLCNDCTLIQQKYTYPQDFLYTRHYWYKSGTTQTIRDDLKQIALGAAELVELKAGDVVLDIGANDGTLLSKYWDGLVRVGVEPARNLAEECKRHCDVFIEDFWSLDAYAAALDAAGYERKYSPLMNPEGIKKAKIITAIGMFYDLEDPNQFIGDVAKVLHREGVFVCQLMCAKQMYQLHDVGNLCHEHIEFYTLSSLITLFERHGLRIFSAVENDINGGSYRIFACKEQARYNRYDSTLETAFQKEKALQITNPHVWKSWAERTCVNGLKIRDFINNAVCMHGKKVWVYGASTKGNVLLQYMDLGPDFIKAAVDKDPSKVGKFTSTGIPIVSEEAFHIQNPDYALVLPYAFIDEFARRETAWLQRGGKFIVPLPQSMLVGARETLLTKELL